jgi:orotidine-5'-phosphate decarboxylase
MPTEQPFNQRLARRCDDTGHVCLGLDPDVAKIVELCEPLAWKPGIAEYCRFVIESTSGVVAAMKFNSAFFEEHGPEGLDELDRTINYARSSNARTVIVLDAKRGDIGNSSKAYARAVSRYDVDATTLSPYMGWDSVEPFLKDGTKGAFVLCRTSNEGSDVFQDLAIEGQPLYLHIAKVAELDWNGKGNCGLVVGATRPDEIAKVVAAAPHLPLLVPGIGAQGGDLEASVRALGSTNAFVINASRSIMYPKGPYKSRDELASAIRSEAENLAREISQAKASELDEV